MTVITMKEAERMIIAAYEKDEPMCIIGPPGCGKTAMLKRIATKVLKIGHIDWRLTLRDPVDVGGMRVPDSKTGKLRHYLPSDLPDVKVHGPKGFFVIDEINVVSQLLQATCYGLVQERRLGEYVMDRGWWPVASGNSVKDRAAAQRMSTALSNRFMVNIVEPDVQSWLDQYGSEHVDSRGCAYLRFRPEMISKLPTDPDQLAWPSSRSWEKFFKFIDEVGSWRRKIGNACVGQVAVEDFEGFWRILESAPTIHEIVADPKKAKIPEERDAGTCYAIAGMLARLVDRKNIDPIFTYIQRLQKDYQVATVQDAVRREPGLKQTNAYGQWAIANQDVLL